MTEIQIPDRKLYTKYSNELGRNVFMREKVLADEVCYRDVFEHQYHVIDLDPAPRTVLDLGANIGFTMAHYRLLWPYAKIHGYEMDEENSVVLWHNLWYGLSENLRFFNEAIWTSSKGVTYEKKRDSEQSYTISKTRSFMNVENDKDINVAKSVTLDTAINRLNTEDGIIDFVKMDIEQAEFPVLASSGAWQHRIRNILVEVHGIVDSDTPRNVEIVKNILEYKGFEVKKHDKHWSALHAWKTIS